MAVVSSHLIDESWGLANRDNTYNATYRVKTNTVMAATAVANGALLALPDPIPAPFATYSLLGTSDPNAFAQKFDAKRDGREKNLFRWKIDVEWSIIEGDASDDTTSESNPLTRPVRYMGEWEEVQVPVEEGWNDENLTGISRSSNTKGPIVNAAGQEPGSPFMRSIKVPVLVASKNYETLDEIFTIGEKYNDCLNSDNFHGRGEEQCLYRGVSISRQLYGGSTPYYTGTHRIAIMRGKWRVALVNRGWSELKSGKITEITIEDADGNKVAPAEPLNLNLDGTRVADGSIGTVINYRTSKKIAFGGAGGLGI